MKKSELVKMVREEILKEISSGYVEAMGPDFYDAVETMKKAFERWSQGPLTSKKDIGPARKDLKQYFNQIIDEYIDWNGWSSVEESDDGWVNNDVVKMFSDNPNIKEYYVIQYSFDDKNWKDTTKVSTDRNMLDKLMKKLLSRSPKYNFRIDVRKN